MRIHPAVLLALALGVFASTLLLLRDTDAPPAPREASSPAPQEESRQSEGVAEAANTEETDEDEATAADAPPAAEARYTFASASPDGIGKFFHGREIAKVMGHPAIGWLERENREDEEAPSKAIAALDLAPSAVIADIGAGSGYYSFRIAPKIPLGRVVAVDIQPEMLDFLKKRSEELKIANVQPHLGTVSGVGLPEKSLDAALMVDAYHEFSEPAEMLDSLFKALKPGGRIFLLEYRGEDEHVPIKPLHKMTEAQARSEFEAAGFKFVRNSEELPWQHLMVFERP